MPWKLLLFIIFQNLLCSFFAVALSVVIGAWSILLSTIIVTFPIWAAFRIAKDNPEKEDKTNLT